MIANWHNRLVHGANRKRLRIRAPGKLRVVLCAVAVCGIVALVASVRHTVVQKDGGGDLLDAFVAAQRFVNDYFDHDVRFELSRYELRFPIWQFDGTILPPADAAGEDRQLCTVIVVHDLKGGWECVLLDVQGQKLHDDLAVVPKEHPRTLLSSSWSVNPVPFTVGLVLLIVSFVCSSVLSEKARRQQKSAEWRFRFAQEALEAGKLQRARATLSKIVESYPSTDFEREAVELLKYCRTDEGSW